MNVIDEINMPQIAHAERSLWRKEMAGVLRRERVRQIKSDTSGQVRSGWGSWSTRANALDEEMHRTVYPTLNMALRYWADETTWRNTTRHHSESLRSVPQCARWGHKTAQHSTQDRHKFYMTVGATLLMCQHIQISTFFNSLLAPVFYKCDAMRWNAPLLYTLCWSSRRNTRKKFFPK